MTKNRMVAILGCGPSGLLAAHACDMHGVPFALFSRKVKSKLGGAQFSHIAIPGIHDAWDMEDGDAKLTYQVRGDADTYHYKVYGDQAVPFVSFGNVHDGQVVPAWSLTKMYDVLWTTYSERITDIDLNYHMVEGMVNGPFDAVFSSVPLPSICRATVDMSVPHVFRQQAVRIYNEAIDPSIPDNTIIYNGEDVPSWYRMSMIFGVGSTEWGVNTPAPPLPNLKVVNKPISSNCNCHPRVERIGRFGAWEKGQLTFHAFNKVEEVLQAW